MTGMARARYSPPRRENLLRRAGVTEVDWKDVSLLREFLSTRGRIRSRRVTGLGPREQRQVARAIAQAREMALLPYPTQR